MGGRKGGMDGEWEGHRGKDWLAVFLLRAPFAYCFTNDTQFPTVFIIYTQVDPYPTHNSRVGSRNKRIE